MNLNYCLLVSVDSLCGKIYCSAFLGRKKIKTSEASLGTLQSGSRKLCFSVEANERSSCNQWDIRLYVCRVKGWRKKQAVCLLLLSVTRNISTLPSDREGLQAGTCNTASKKPLLPIQVTMHLIFTKSFGYRIMSPFFLWNDFEQSFSVNLFQILTLVLQVLKLPGHKLRGARHLPFASPDPFSSLPCAAGS